ncbi:DNA methylase, partial [Enterococcus faecium]
PTDECNLLTTMNEVISQSFKSYSWMYETMVDGEAKLINYVVWSDVLVCPNCQSEFPFYEVAYDPISNSVLKDFSCPSCKAQLTKEKSERLFESLYDEVLKKNVRLGKQVPVAINYISGKAKKMKKIDQHDLDLIKRINQTKLIHWVPSSRIPEGVNTRQPRISHGINYVHQFYTKRNLIILSDLYNRISKLPEDVRVTAYLSLQSIVYTLTSKLVRYNLGNRGNGILNGTLYIPSLVAESNVYKILEGKVKDISKAMVVKERDVISSVESATNSRISANSIDYIFTDPPFGANINYSELNFIWEDWLKVKTETTDEAIINQIQKKDLFDYQRLMEDSFSSYYYVLKPNRWITVEFSNSKASVWNSIQEAMQKAGFIIANVSALDKKQGSFKAVTSTTAVKQDLVISAYKPSEENIEKMKAQRNNVESAWTFVTQHLSNLPVFMGDKGDAIIISERTPRILFDRMVAYHVQQGLPVPISSADFQSGVASRYLMRDGMAFLDSQVAEYDKKRILAREFAQLSLFVSDENSAIEWIRQQLMKKPQSRQDIHPHFMKEIQHIAKYEELPELDELLAQNFLYYDGNGAVPNQISTYLTKNYHELRGLEKSDALLREKAKNRWYVPNPNQQADLEKLREKNLLREFSHYLDEINNSKKKLKVFRTEAIRVGFKKAWTEKEYQTIVTVGERLPEKVIQEDDKLLMYYDNALMRIEM